jgi:broad specificity phosphatase PhoE
MTNDFSKTKEGLLLANVNAVPLKVASQDGIQLGVELQSHSHPGWSNATIKILRPFSWDAKDRAFELVDIALREKEPVILVSGPYATADAAAWNVDPEKDIGFPENEEYDGVLYIVDGRPAEADDRYQDGAGWFTISGEDLQGNQNFIVVALEKSNTQLVRVILESGTVHLSLILPKQVYPVEACSQLIDLPQMKIESGLGSHKDGQSRLRKIIREAMPERARDYQSPLVVDTWGFGTNVNQELVTAVAKTAKELDLEILTVDKGWEKIVGDWDTGAHFPDGLAGLAKITSDHGTRLGLWASLGNADPLSDVARAHPDWIATWRGKVQVVSHRTNSLCLGHSAVIDYLAKSIANLADNGLTWLLHDFETISRCDSDKHDHPAGLGEDWAVRGWYSLLSEFRNRYPDVWIENCWNGARPLDLQVVAHHDTTIGDDWCDVRHNAVAKVGLGQFLPAHWCSSYMSDQNQLPLRSQLAIYAIGGPWILMGDIPNWSDEKLELSKKVMTVYRSWRALFPFGSVDWSKISGWEPDSRWRADQEVLALSFIHPTGKELMAAVIATALIGGEIRWHPQHQGAMNLVDEFTGESWSLTEQQVKEGIVITGIKAQGYLFSAVPI